MRIATLLAAAALAVAALPLAASAGDGAGGGAPAPPPPDPVTEAARLTAEASAMAQAGDMLGAAGRFRAAHAVDPRAERLCNVGIAFHKAKDLPRAHLYLGQCLTRAGSIDASIAASVRTVFGAIEDALRTGAFAPVDITVTPDTAMLLVSAFDPEDAMVGARLVWLPFGHHTITARAEGHVEQARAIDVTEPAGQTVRIVLGRTPVVEPPPAPVPVTTHPHARRPAVLATAGTALLGGGALAAYLLARSAASDAGEAGITDDQYDDRVERARFRQHLSWDLADSAAVGAAVSGWLWYRSTETRTIFVEVAPSPGGASMAISGHF